MACLYFSTTRHDGNVISLGPMTNRKAETIDPPLESMDGYFLLQSDGISNRILARVSDDEAAMSLAKLLGMF